MSNAKHVVLDSHTFDLLTELTEDARVTKATYLRQLIREAALRQGKSNVIPLGVTAMASITAEAKQEIDVPFTIKHGKWIPVKELDMAERFIDWYGKKRGKNIDVPWARSIYDFVRFRYAQEAVPIEIAEETR